MLEFTFNRMYLWIDYWTKNIGVAWSKIGIALPLGIFEYRDFFKKLPHIVHEKRVTTIVVGEAIGYDAYGKQKQFFQEAVTKIQKLVPSVTVVVQDEDLSTFEAQESLNFLETDDHLDDIAACIILQRYLDSVHLSQDPEKTQ